MGVITKNPATGLQESQSCQPLTFSEDLAGLSVNYRENMQSSRDPDLLLYSPPENSEERLGQDDTSASSSTLEHDLDNTTDPNFKLVKNVLYRDDLAEDRAIPRHTTGMPELLEAVNLSRTWLALSPEVGKPVEIQNFTHRDSSDEHEDMVLQQGKSRGHSQAQKVKCDENCYKRQEDDRNIKEPRRLASFPSVVIAVVMLQCCVRRRLNATRRKSETPSTNASLYHVLQGHFAETNISEVIDLCTRLSISRRMSNGSDTRSTGSSEEYNISDLIDGSDGDWTSQWGSPTPDIDIAKSKEFLPTIQSALDRLPPFVAACLAVQMCSIINSLLRKTAFVQRAGRSYSSSSSSTQNVIADSPNVTSSAGKSKKRSSDEDDKGSNPARNGGGGGGGGKQQKTSKISSEGSKKEWACPFYQRNPGYYCTEREFGKYHSCSRSRGNQVHRIKTHLRRSHVAIYCDRCYCQFKTRKDLRSHLRDSRPACNVRDPQPLYGLTEQQLEQLGSKHSKITEEQRWAVLYKICFPDDIVIPTPYYVHYSEDMELLRRDILGGVVSVTAMLEIQNEKTDYILQEIRDAFDRYHRRSRSDQSSAISVPSNDEMGFRLATTLASDEAASPYLPASQETFTELFDMGDHAYQQILDTDDFMHGANFDFCSQD